jgi:YidC/Oxa1 family membrane protein insertase
MDIWATWLDSIGSILTLLSSGAGLGLGLAIVVGTLLLRAVLLPLAWPIAYRACLRQKKMAKLQPELRALQDRYRDKPEVYVEKLRELYRAHGLALIDTKSFVGALAQLPIFLGMFHVLRNAGDGARFLWVGNLLRPDIALALIAGLTTALMMAVNPDLPEHLRIVMIVLPTIVAVVAALQFSSALALYWATSNTFSAIQTVLLHLVVQRRMRAGAIQP